MCGPANGQDFAGANLAVKITDHRSMAGQAHGSFDGAAASDANHFVASRHRAPLATVKIAVRLQAMDLLAVKIDVVADRGGYSPGDPAVVADVNVGTSGHGGAPGLVPFGRRWARLRPQMHQVPDRWQRHAQMRIVAKHGASRSGTLGRDHPTVAAVAGRMPVAGQQCAVYESPDALRGVFNRARNRRPVLRIGWKQGTKFFRLTLKPGGDGDHVEAGEERGRNQERESFLNGEAVLGSPGI